MGAHSIRRDKCRLCSSKNLSLAFALAPTPPANAFLPKDEWNKIPEEKFPLDVFFCRDCAHLQLLDVVNPTILFSHYVYVSGTSPVFVEHFRKYFEAVSNDYGLKSGDRVFEVGSNDGTLLRFFQKAGMQVLGVDPAQEIAAKATHGGIPTETGFFNEAYGKKVSANWGKAKVVLANNVFAHIDDLASVARGIREILTDDGVFVFEVSYLRDVIEKTLFDTIYHEHLCFHTLGPLGKFFERLSMVVTDAERVDSHGGSIRVFVRKSGVASSRLNRLLEEEKALGLYEEKTFVAFAGQIRKIGDELREFLREAKAEGRKVVGFGAPAKATTLMHHFSLGSDSLDYIVDDSPLKQGLYTPGLHVPVVPSSALKENPPDYVLVLAWNFADSIIQKNKSVLKKGAAFVVPLPRVKVVRCE